MATEAIVRGKELISKDGRRCVGVVAREGAELTEEELARASSLNVDATTKKEQQARMKKREKITAERIRR
jgi:hypothetical protein